MCGFTQLQKRFIEQNIENTAILFNTPKSRKRIEQLLSTAEAQQKQLHITNEELELQTETLRASERQLQTQQEELRVINEELEEQTRALKESEAELQAQQEELQVANEELEERTNALEQQKDAFRNKNIELIKAQQIVKQKARDQDVLSGSHLTSPVAGRAARDDGGAGRGGSVGGSSVSQ
jgi:tubulin-specific chaperone A